MIVLLTLAFAPAPAQAATVRTYYLDCGAGNDASTGFGTTTAFRSLARVNKINFKPGDRLLLRRGTTCHGTLQPRGSGSPQKPIQVRAYGTGALPALIGTGARATVLLHNVEGWELSQLDISNPGPRDGTSRAGILVRLENFGTGRHYVIDEVTVHDVTGCDCTGPDSEPSGGVVVQAVGTVTPTGLDGLLVNGSSVRGVDGYGIATSSRWNARPRYPDGAGTFVPMTGVRIRGNQLRDLGGDGIVVQNGLAPVIESNVIAEFGTRAATYHLGVYAWNSDDALIQYNDVSGGSGAPFPAPAYGVEGGNSNVTVQYNVSSGNGGGFLYLCADQGMSTDDVTVRYNLSREDRNADLGGFITPLIGNCFGDTTSGMTVVNNVVDSTAAVFVSLFGPAATFRNNIFTNGDGPASIQDDAGSYDHNLFHAVVPPVGANGAVEGDPMFAGGATTAAYRLRCSSPAIGAGVPVEVNATDFFGYPVPAAAPSLGISQQPCTP
jgi:hypothetical protein